MLEISCYTSLSHHGSWCPLVVGCCLKHFFLASLPWNQLKTTMFHGLNGLNLSNPSFVLLPLPLFFWLSWAPSPPFFRLAHPRGHRPCSWWRDRSWPRKRNPASWPAVHPSSSHGSQGSQPRTEVAQNFRRVMDHWCLFMIVWRFLNVAVWICMV